MVQHRKGRRSFGTSRRLPSGRWQARYRAPDGRRVTAPTTFLTKTEADRYLAMVEADMHRGAWIDPRLSKTTFTVWAERWWTFTKPTLRLKTQVRYRSILDRYLLVEFGDYRLAAIDLLTVRAWLAKLYEKKAGAAVTAKAYQLLKQILNAAVEVGYLLRNPCTVKGAGKEPTPELRIPVVAEVAKLADTIDLRYRALVLVACYAAFRWGELVGLRRHRIDMDAGTIEVVEQVIEVRGRLHPGPLKSEAGRRVVHLPEFVMVELTRHLERYAGPEPTGLVFPAPKGGHLRSSNFRAEVWKPATKRAGLDGVRIHDLRHAGATFAAQAGATTKELMVRIGHTTPSTALRYQHAQAERDRAIADRLGQLVNGEDTSRGTQWARKPAAKRDRRVRKPQRDAD